MDKELRSIPIGKAEILRSGDDVAIMALGATVTPALEAADELAARGIQATVLDGRFAKPLDCDLIIDIARRIKNIVTIEENVLSGGFGSRVSALLQEKGLSDVRVKSIGIPDEFVEHGTQAILRAKYNLDKEGILNQTLLLLNQAESASHPDSQQHTKATPF